MNIIFDFDGTLADTFDTTVKIFNKHSQEFGIDGIDPDEIKPLKDRSAIYLLKEFKMNIFHANRILKTINGYMKSEIANTRPFEGIPQVLTSLKNDGHLLGIVTGNLKENVEIFLEANNLASFFDFVHSEKHLFGKHKPIKKLIKKNKMEKEATLYVGDMVRDISAGHKADIKAVSVTWGYNSKKALQDHDPDYIVDTPQELLATIKKINENFDKI